MQRTRIQRGGVNLDVSSSDKQIWVFRWRETRPDGRRAPRKKVIGTLEEYPTKKAAESAARGFRLDLVDQGSAALSQITMKELVDHFSEHES
jgi:integrase